MYKPLDYNLLKSKNACVKQLELFKEHFGVDKSVPLTEEVALKFGSLFDVGWAARSLLTSGDWGEYEKVRAQSAQRLVDGGAQAWAKYNKVYKKVCAQASAEYTKACAQASAEYTKACAVEFARIYKRGLTSQETP